MFLVLCMTHGDPSINIYALSPSLSFFSNLVHSKQTKVPIANLHCLGISCLRWLGIFWLIGIRVQLGTECFILEATGRSPSELLALSNAPSCCTALWLLGHPSRWSEHFKRLLAPSLSRISLSIPQKSWAVWFPNYSAGFWGDFRAHKQR